MSDQKAQIGDVIIIPTKVGEYVVEEASMRGGGRGHGCGDVFPDAWHVTARKLASDGTYNPSEGVVTFTQNASCYTSEIVGVQVVRKMKRTFTA